MCAPEVSGHVMTLETEYGIPTVGVHGAAFARLVDSVVKVNGMPRARRAYVPMPVLTKTPASSARMSTATTPSPAVRSCSRCSTP